MVSQPSGVGDDRRIASLNSIRIVLRHPSLALHFYESAPELSRRHVEIELKRVKALYDALAPAEWNPEGVITAYCTKIPCYTNGYLYAFSRHFRPGVFVETGVSYGASSAFILQAMHDNGLGHLHSIDLPNQRYLKDDGTMHQDSLKPETAGIAVPASLRERWTLLLGDAKQKLPELLQTLESIDIFHHDSMHTYEHMRFEYELAWPKLRKGGYLLSDDVLWNSAFTDFCHEHGVQPNIVEGRGFVEKPE